MLTKCNKRCSIVGVATSDSKCIGCGRTLKEIQMFGRLAVIERRKEQIKQAVL